MGDAKMTLALLLLSLTGVVHGAPLAGIQPSSPLAPPPTREGVRQHEPSTAILTDIAVANMTAKASGSLGEYLTSALVRWLPTPRRCGGRRKGSCVSGSGSRSSSPSPPPPTLDTQIAQRLVLQARNGSQYAGIYQLVMETGWGISIGVYEESRQGWKAGVRAASRELRRTCDAISCRLELLFTASIPAAMGHRANLLSAASFCNGVASAKEAMARTQRQQGAVVASVRVPKCTDANVTVLPPDVLTHTKDTKQDTKSEGLDIGLVIVGSIFVGVLCSGLLCAMVGDKVSSINCKSANKPNVMPEYEAKPESTIKPEPEGKPEPDISPEPEVKLEVKCQASADHEASEEGSTHETVIIDLPPPEMPNGGESAERGGRVCC